jgi:hypothetical protein
MNTRRKPWLRFSLRGAIVLITIVAVTFGIVANQANRQLTTLAAIKEVGGSYRHHRDSQGFVAKALDRCFGEKAFSKITMVNLRDTDASDELIGRIAKFQTLSDVDLSGTKTTDAGIQLISKLPLRVLWIQECPITDESGKHLAEHKTLQRLLANGTICTDTFIENLGSLPQLKDLGLRGTKVTSDGMRHIASCPKLEKLYLYSTVVDDDGINHLRDNATITKLDLSSTNVTDDSFEIFETLPSLNELDLNACRGITRNAANRFARTKGCRVDCNSRN